MFIFGMFIGLLIACMIGVGIMAILQVSREGL